MDCTIVTDGKLPPEKIRSSHLDLGLCRRITQKAECANSHYVDDKTSLSQSSSKLKFPLTNLFSRQSTTTMLLQIVMHEIMATDRYSVSLILGSDLPFFIADEVFGRHRF